VRSESLRRLVAIIFNLSISRRPADLMDPLRLALVGCGGISEAHVRGLERLRMASLDTVEVVATCDVVEDAAIKRAQQISKFQKTRPRVYTQLDSMLQKEDLDAVDICTDHSTHHTVALRCMEEGRHVLVEKPVGITIRAGRMMVREAERKNLVLAVAENYRRSAQNRAINWAIRSGRIGQPNLFFWHELSYWLGAWGWRHDKLKAGGGWILDGGVHLADLLLYNIGTVDAVFAVTKTLESLRYEDWPSKERPSPYTVEDVSMAIIEFESGASGVWTWSSVVPGEKLQRRLIAGSRGSVDWDLGLTEIGDGGSTRTTPLDDLAKQMLSEIDPDERERLFPSGVGLERPDFSSTVALEILDFARAVLEGTRPEVDGNLGLEAEAIPMAIYESSATGRKVKVRDVLEMKVEVYQAPINESLGLSG